MVLKLEMHCYSTDSDHLGISQMLILYIKHFLTYTLDPKMETQCVSFTLPQQFIEKYNQNSEEDLLRTCKSFLLSHVYALTLVSCFG